MSFLPLSALPPHPSSSSPSPSSHHQQPAPLLPSALSHDPDISASYPSYPPPPPHPPTPFHPLFTLLSNSSTTYHPTIHYVFADDDDDNDTRPEQHYDPITAAALHVLDPSSSSSVSSTSPTSSSVSAVSGGITGTRSRQDDDEDEDDGKKKTKGKKKKAVKTRKERYVLLDMDNTGTKFVSAQSMSVDWAVTGTELGAAPTWDRDVERDAERRGLMLRIEGVEVNQKGMEDDSERGGEREREGEEDEKGLEELVEVYERQMGELRRVVESGIGTVTGTGIGTGDHSS